MHQVSSQLNVIIESYYNLKWHVPSSPHPLVLGTWKIKKAQPW